LKQGVFTGPQNVLKSYRAFEGLQRSLQGLWRSSTAFKKAIKGISRSSKASKKIYGPVTGATKP
jgi:hypothetical protein